MPKKKERELLVESHLLSNGMSLGTRGNGQLVNPYLEKGMAKEGWCYHLSWGPILGGRAEKAEFSEVLGLNWKDLHQPPNETVGLGQKKKGKKC